MQYVNDLFFVSFFVLYCLFTVVDSIELTYNTCGSGGKRKQQEGYEPLQG
jgi:hypothetical protein